MLRRSVLRQGLFWLIAGVLMFLVGSSYVGAIQ